MAKKVEDLSLVQTLSTSRIIPGGSSTSRIIPIGSSTLRTFPGESSISNIILSKEVEGFSSIFQASQAIPPVKEVEDSSSYGSNLSNIILSKKAEDSSSNVSNIIPMEEVEDSPSIIQAY